MRIDGPLSPWSRLALAVAIVLGLAASSGFGQDRGNLTLACLEIRDVGRGAGLAVVIEAPGGKTYLYDTGSG